MRKSVTVSDGNLLLLVSESIVWLGGFQSDPKEWVQRSSIRVNGIHCCSCALMCEPNTHRCNSMSHVQVDLSRHVLASGWLEQGVVSYNRKHGELMHHMTKTPLAWDRLLSHETSRQSGRLRPDTGRERDSWHEKTPNRDRKLNLHA